MPTRRGKSDTYPEQIVKFAVLDHREIGVCCISPLGTGRYEEDSNKNLRCEWVGALGRCVLVTGLSNAVRKFWPVSDETAQWLRVK